MVEDGTLKVILCQDLDVMGDVAFLLGGSLEA